MQESAYYLVLQYLKEQKRGITPAELSTVLKRSRVTIQSSLKRLMKNGWVTKEGESPRTWYIAKEVTAVPRLSSGAIAESGETIEREGNKLEEVEKSLSFGLLEDFVRKSNSVARVTPQFKIST